MSKKMSSTEKAAALKVVCPRCGVWVREDCIHTTGSKCGQKTDPHPDRIKLAQVNLSPSAKKKIREMEEEEPVKSHKTPKDKLSPEQRLVTDKILEKIHDLGKNASFVGPVTTGPIISTYRFMPEHKTRVAHLEGLWKDFAVILGCETLVVKRMPGESAVGVFVPNKERTIIRLQDTLKNVMAYNQEKSNDGHRRIPLNFGITAQGEPFVDDLTVQPHVLLAGATDSGKSTLALCFILSMAWAMSPRDLRMLISDTKKVEFRPYFAKLPHLERPIAGDLYETMQMLEWTKRETQRRLDEYAKFNTRNIHEYNRANPNHQMNYIILYIDEIADIMGDQVDRTEAKANSMKLGAIVGRSRAAGIYVIAGTQRPSVNIVKGSIKANFPSRVAFRLPSSQDSRTIINTKGAENLMSRGDMFYMSSMSSELRRLHAPFTELADVKTLVEAIIQREEGERAKREAATIEDRMPIEERERVAIQQEGSNQTIDMYDKKKIN